jgi:hypothetical protein
MSHPWKSQRAKSQEAFIRKNRLLSTAELFVDTGPDGSFL